MKRVGLFVGIDHYKNGITSLNCSCNDATELSLLFAAEQFDKVDLLLDDKAHCEAILDHVDEMTSDLKPGDLFVFYFAGHGREFNNEHYLLGPTSRADEAFFRKGTVTVPELIAASDRNGINRLFVLDCCRTPLVMGRSGEFSCAEARDISLKSAIKNVVSQGGLPPLIINSCSAAQQAFELQEKGHGVFTLALLNVLRDEKAPVMNFSHLLESLDRKIQKFIPDGKKQNIYSAGNLSLWNNVPLFGRWTRALENGTSLALTMRRSLVLSGEERQRFYEELLNCEHALAEIQVEKNFPEEFQVRFSELKKSLKEFMALENMTQNDLFKLQQVHENIDGYKTSKNDYLSCQSSIVQLRKSKKYLLSQSQEPLDQFKEKEQLAIQALKSKDYSVAKVFLKSAEKILAEQAENIKKIIEAAQDTRRRLDYAVGKIKDYGKRIPPKYADIIVQGERAWEEKNFSAARDCWENILLRLEKTIQIRESFIKKFKNIQQEISALKQEINQYDVKISPSARESLLDMKTKWENKQLSDAVIAAGVACEMIQKELDAAKKLKKEAERRQLQKISSWTEQVHAKIRELKQRKQDVPSNIYLMLDDVQALTTQGNLLQAEKKVEYVLEDINERLKKSAVLSTRKNVAGQLSAWALTCALGCWGSSLCQNPILILVLTVPGGLVLERLFCRKERGFQNYLINVLFVFLLTVISCCRSNGRELLVLFLGGGYFVVYSLCFWLFKRLKKA